MKYKKALSLIVIFLIGLYFVLANALPKYEIYQGEGGLIQKEGTITYRFNKITGTIQCIDYTKRGDLRWRDRKPLGDIKKP